MCWSSLTLKNSFVTSRVSAFPSLLLKVPRKEAADPSDKNKQFELPCWPCPALILSFHLILDPTEKSLKEKPRQTPKPKWNTVNMCAVATINEFHFGFDTKLVGSIVPEEKVGLLVHPTMLYFTALLLSLLLRKRHFTSILMPSTNRRKRKSSNRTELRNAKPTSLTLSLPLQDINTLHETKPYRPTLKRQTVPRWSRWQSAWYWFKSSWWHELLRIFYGGRQDTSGFYAS